MNKTYMNNKELKKFSFEHFTYINQIFGDLNVREIIKESYAPQDWDFLAEVSGNDFEDGFHHVLVKKNKKGKNLKKWCSVDEGFQNLNVNINDNLCQSYTLLKYFNKQIYKNKSKKNQKSMINLYRNILKRNHFKKEFKSLIEYNKKSKKNPWKIYTNKKTINLPMNYYDIIENINKTLDNWEKYGYHHFIKKGKI